MLGLQHMLSLLLLAPLSTYADSHDIDEARLRPKWQALDANRDGRVALDELHPMQARAMKGNDLDRDGVISLAEYVFFDRDPGGDSRLPLADNVRLIPNLAYAASGDPRQRLDVYLPKQPNVGGPLPVIAYVHGGGWFMGSHVMGRLQIMPHVNSGRYAAVSIGYRLSWQDSWPAQIHDVKAGIRWIRAHAQEYGLDPSRICAMGPSAGGHLVAELGTTNGVTAVEGMLGEHTDQSSNVQCVIDFWGPTDLRNSTAGEGGRGTPPVAMLLGGRVQDNPVRAAEASPLHHVDSGDPPFLIVHGTKDPVVNYSESVALEQALRKAGVPVIFQTIEGGGHGNFASAGPGGVGSELNRRVRVFLEKTFYDPSLEVPHDTIDFTPPLRP